MALTQNGAQQIITALVSGKYVALSTNTLDTMNGGAGFTEPTASEYRRVGLQGNLGDMTYNASTGTGTIKNNNILYYPEADPGGSGTATGWGTNGKVYCFGLFTAATGGNLLVYGQLNGSSSGVTINANTVPLFRAEQLSVTVQ